MTDTRPRPIAPPATMREAAAEHPFWRFSLAVYGRPGVAEAALGFQDRRGADINVLLFLLWRTTKGYSVPDDVLSRALRVSATWQESVLGPVRRARRAVRLMQDLCAHLKETELACEQSEQMALAALVDNLEDEVPAPDNTRRSTAEAALKTYLSTLPTPALDNEQDALKRMIDAALDTVGVTRGA